MKRIYLSLIEMYEDGTGTNATWRLDERTAVTLRAAYGPPEAEQILSAELMRKAHDIGHQAPVNFLDRQEENNQ